MRIFLLSLIIYWNIQFVHAQQLEPIDSAYLKTLLNFSKNVATIKDSIWPGMKIGPSCIFRINGPAFLINHPQPPVTAKCLADSIYMFSQADIALAGTSQTEINHHLTAHNNYAQSFYVSPNQFYAELFHELHHVYQRNYIKKMQFDNPAELLTYPEDYRNDALKQYENEVLLELLSGPSSQFNDNINKFFTCRTLRKEIIGEKYINYEKKVESAEGPATYCEYKYMKEFSTMLKEQEYIHKRFFYSLIEPTYGRNGLRNKHLLSGMVQCLLLERKFKNWQTEYYNSGLLLNDYFFSKFIPKPVKLPAISFARANASYFTNLEKEQHNLHLAMFASQKGIKVTLLFKSLPEFRGFDPMHAEAINDSLTLHSTLLKLGKDQNHLTLVNQRVVTVTNGQVWFVKRATFFAPENAIRFNGDLFTCTKEDLDVSWKYVKQEKNGNEYVITLE